MLRKLFLSVALSLGLAVQAEDFTKEGSDAVSVASFPVSTAYVWTNAERDIVRPVSIEITAPAVITNTFSVKHVRSWVTRQYSTNNFLQPTNTITLSVTNYWLLKDAERNVIGNSVTITNDQTVTLQIEGEPYLVAGDIVTIANSYTNYSGKTVVILKGN